MTHLSLFTGIGGLDLAAEWAGFETVGQCEWAEYPTKVLEKHWPEVPRWRDIKTLTGDSFYEKTGLRTIDLISGGFPCQPFSTAGSRRGKNDDRYLWPEMLRVIKELRPTWIVCENVAGLISMEEPDSEIEVEGRTISRMPDADYYEAIYSRKTRMLLPQILDSIEQAGYEVQAFTIPACAVDAPHRRDRLAIVGHRTGVVGRGERAVAYGNNRKRNGSQHKIQAGRDAAFSGCETVGNTNGERLQIGRQEPGIKPAKPKNGTPLTGWWPAEPCVGRVADGVPNRVDRIRCLGNAVVPHQFFPIFKAIAEVEHA